MLKIALELKGFLIKTWLKLDIHKDKRKVLQYELIHFIKVAKTNSKHYTHCFWRIKRLWCITDCNKFSCLHYFQYNKTYFQFITIIIKLFLTTSCCQKAL